MAGFEVTFEDVHALRWFGVAQHRLADRDVLGLVRPSAQTVVETVPTKHSSSATSPRAIAAGLTNLAFMVCPDNGLLRRESVKRTRSRHPCCIRFAVAIPCEFSPEPRTLGRELCWL
jgi:hypothetical protein